jgi:hypothetical protein
VVFVLYLGMNICINNVSYFKDFAQLLIALSSLIVAVVALRLSRKTTLKKNLKEKQFDLVFQLIKDFSSDVALLRYQDQSGDGGTTLIYLYQFKSNKFKGDYDYLFKRKHFIFYNSIQSKFEFLKHTWNPLMPRPIFLELRKLYTTWDKNISESELFDLADFVVLDSAHDGNFNKYNQPKGQEFKDFESFYNYINLLMDKINEWLDEHEADDLKFRSDN